MADTLCARLAGYDGIAAFTERLPPRLIDDAWRGTDGLRREKQLPIDYPCARSGGPMLYTARDTKTSHRGMRIAEGDIVE